MNYIKRNFNVILAILALGFVAIYGTITNQKIEELQKELQEGDKKIQEDISTVREKLEIQLDSVKEQKKKPNRQVNLTFYHPVPDQCGSNPLVTADGSKINLRKLHSSNLRWCAVSHDLKKHYKFGTKIHIESEDPRINGVWIVHDLMAKRHKNKIDLLMPEGTLAYVRKANIIKVEG